MLHKTLEAKATATDLGEFTAIAAAYSVDRGRERIIPGAFAATIAQWQASGKQIPLHWDHSGEPEDIIGTVDPAQIEETKQGLKVAGRLDLAGSDVAKEAWRLMKSGSMGLSFGYMVTEGADAKDGVYEIKGIDLFEISVTPTPMNADTRFLSLKSVKQMTPQEMQAELDAMTSRIDEMRDVLAKSTEPDVPPPPADEVKDVPDEEPAGPTPQASDPEAVHYELERLQALT